ncbi:hypothetical protein [Acinetobacter cumulans]|uniref:hypothetical protein n=1 Tax=Acinetobacter cumulans TaxID=2136182 RepID=UPI001443FDE8|nr:hypothetical protein [Acinetobacter cumulans]
MVDVCGVCDECKPDVECWMGQFVCSCCRDALEDCMSDDIFSDEDWGPAND